MKFENYIAFEKHYGLLIKKYQKRIEEAKNRYVSGKGFPEIEIGSTVRCRLSDRYTHTIDEVESIFLGYCVRENGDVYPLLENNTHIEDELISIEIVNI